MSGYAREANFKNDTSSGKKGGKILEVNYREYIFPSLKYKVSLFVVRFSMLSSGS